MAQTVRGLIRHPEVIEAALGYEDRCGVTTLESSPDLSVQRIVWPAGVRLPPHDHGMWSVVGVYRGVEDNHLYVEKEGVLIEDSCQSLPAGDVLVLGPEAIHALVNPGSVPCVTLHVYGGDIVNQERCVWDFSGRRKSGFCQEETVRMLSGLRGREDDLGRPLTQSETTVLLTARYSS